MNEPGGGFTIGSAWWIGYGLLIMAKGTLYHYPGCSTCKTARRWLTEQGIEVQLVDIVENPPSAASLKRAIAQSGLPIKKFFNTSGQSYRQGQFGERLKTLTDAEAIQALAADGKLIKRPLLIAGDLVLVGFKAEEWAEKLA